MTISVVQFIPTSNNASAGTITQAITTTSTNGILHVCVSCQSAETITGVSDGTNTYNLLDALTGTAGSVNVAHYYAYGVAPGTYTITASFSAAATGRQLLVKEIASGAVTTVDKHTGQVQATPTTTTNATTSGATATLGTQPALTSGFCISTQYSGAADTAGTGFTSDGVGSSGFVYTFVAESLRVTATTGIAATFTSAANFEHVSLVAVFDELTTTYTPFNQTQFFANDTVFLS
jgi:hypothetical protein